MQKVEANMAVSVTALKKSPKAVMDEASGEPVAVLNHNKIMAYLVPAGRYERMLELIDDQKLARTIRGRAHETPIPVDLDDL